MDFYTIGTKENKDGSIDVYPDFRVGRSQDLMVKGKAFYAIWDEELGLWSTDEYDVQRLVDEELQAYVNRNPGIYNPKYLHSFGNNGWAQFQRFLKNVSDNAKPLDVNLTFANTEVRKTDYVSRRLAYPLESGPCSAWDELVGTLYSIDERAKIEWLIGSVVAGDSKTIQKFGVFYGPPGSGKSTVLSIVEKLFEGYCTTFDAKALGQSNAQFATDVFRNNPLVVVQHDTDLSRIEDNARLNSIISHENMSMNEKYKPSASSKAIALALIGTNKPVKISDAKSGLLRRLLDIHPTGVRIPINHYFALISKAEFELGAIAHRCLEVYQNFGKHHFEAYRPTTMMYQTDIFFNFVESVYDVFSGQDYVSLKQAYALYKTFCSETGIDKPWPQYKMRSELESYFDEFHDKYTVDGHEMRSVFLGFNAAKFKTPTKDKGVFSLVLDQDRSLFDDEMASQPAQLANQNGLPGKKWENVKTTLSQVDTSELHYVLVPERHIVIDFDLKDSNGTKALERNLEAASLWPATYGELSKSGEGVHLHYLFEGDVSELAGSYSDGIEIKTLLGNASLRRRLTKCNHVPIAVMKPGYLPKKEKKVQTVKQVQSEKGLREQVLKNLRKQYHSSTKSSIDFIKQILDDAYDQGLAYDLRDMRPAVLSFAMKSTNQAFNCLKTVQTMRFHNDRVEEEVQPEVRDDRIAIFDLEVFPNLFMVGYSFVGDDEVTVLTNPTPQDMEELFRLKLVGFYNRRYDNHIAYARYLGYTNEQLYRLSQKLIVDRNNSAMFGEAYNLSYADIWDFSSVKQSLKKFQIDLGLHHRELNLPWDEPVPDDKVAEVEEYMRNDILTTKEVFLARKQDFVARQILAELSGLTVNDTTQRHTAKIIFGNDRNPQVDFEYTDLSEEFPGYHYDAGVSTYRGETVGEGGYVYAEPGMYRDVALLDVASMHPTSIRVLNAFGPYTRRFGELVDARLAIKAGDLDTAKGMLDGRLGKFLRDDEDLDDLSYALKIVINIVYGLTAAKFENPFRDPRNNDNIVAKRGALFMVDLKTACQEKGLTVAHIKTDSIKIPGATPQDIDEIMRFGDKYGYTFEHEATYDRFCLVNDAVYIAREEIRGQNPVYNKDGVRISHRWKAVGAQFQHPVVFKSLFSQEEIKLEDYFETKQVVQGAIYMDFEPDRPMALAESMQFIGKTGMFVPVKEGTVGGGLLYRLKDEKLYRVQGTKGYLWKEAEAFRMFNTIDDVDLEYFEKLTYDAVKTIEKFGSFEDFVS